MIINNKIVAKNTIFAHIFVSRFCYINKLFINQTIELVRFSNLKSIYFLLEKKYDKNGLSNVIVKLWQLTFITHLREHHIQMFQSAKFFNHI